MKWSAIITSAFLVVVGAVAAVLVLSDAKEGEEQLPISEINKTVDTNDDENAEGEKSEDKNTEKDSTFAYGFDLSNSVRQISKDESAKNEVVPTPEPTPEPTFPEEKMVPGLRTVKNFLATALAPVGKVLWVTGGGWTYNDDGADEAARSIGLSKTWLDFFKSEDADYDVNETWPVEGKNVAHEKGLDNAGYLGWTLYNILFSESLVNDGFVSMPDGMVELLKDYADFESADDLVGKTPAEIAAGMHPGDFAMMPGQHMYIVIGKCEDGSMLISHVAMGYSSTEVYGGSVQVSAVVDGSKVESEIIEASEVQKNEEEIKEENVEKNFEEPVLGEQEESESPEAVELAETYMSKYPEWDERYDVQTKEVSVYMNFYNDIVGPEANGIFHWKEGVLEDPDGYREMTATEIMEDLYK